MSGILLSNWPVLTALIGLMFVRRITLQSIQPSRCSGEQDKKCFCSWEVVQRPVHFMTDNVSKVFKISRAYRLDQLKDIKKNINCLLRATYGIVVQFFFRLSVASWTIVVFGQSISGNSKTFKQCFFANCTKRFSAVP